MDGQGNASSSSMSSSSLGGQHSNGQSTSATSDLSQTYEYFNSSQPSLGVGSGNTATNQSQSGGYIDSNSQQSIYGHEIYGINQQQIQQLQQLRKMDDIHTQSQYSQSSMTSKSTIQSAPAAMGDTMMLQQLGFTSAPTDSTMTTGNEMMTPEAQWGEYEFCVLCSVRKAPNGRVIFDIHSYEDEHLWGEQMMD
ncbi:uncharacterized protein FA14DRAFT_157773 [Meira miltonrushii]|uniref:Uncharacterized protein n=1 Tax=Meira miltonrushii TaxID=1280837 RepID=A0A316V9H3_9BASI|nr:uncharacterized protein FA14DRAFT_157773 [Meira miltonrushii]PWN33091.1 hypothetical protein FA14DRAFT_157773 [Meira miltonrushii]